MQKSLKHGTLSTLGIEEIIKWIANSRVNPSLRLRYIKDSTRDFTRKRTLTFTVTALYILHLVKKSLAAALIEKTALWSCKKPPTKSAFVQARKKLKLVFFEDLFQKTKAVFYHPQDVPNNGLKKWKGFRLLACDGTGFRVPDNPNNRQRFSVHKNQYKGLASCKMVAFHDVLNRVFIELFFHKRKDAELTVVHQNFDKIPSDVVMIYDRAYGDSLLLARHLKAKKPCVIRMKNQGSNVVKSFLKSGKKEAIVDFKIGERAYKSAKIKYGLKNNFPKFSTFKIRLIKIILDNGTIEVLATTLLDRVKYLHSEFKVLYSKRWGVETAFDEVKNQLKLGVFSGYNYHTVMQDIWAVFIFYNLRSLLIFYSEQTLDNRPPSKRRKYKKHQVNRNIAITIIRTHFFDLFNLKRLSRTVKKILKMLGEHIQRIRIRPPTERKKKLMRANTRHQTEKNYKPAL